MTCIKCGGTMIGDGYHSPIHCEFIDISHLCLEADANPVYCNFRETESILTEDDCAPDAREYFEKDFEKIVGTNLSEFQKNNPNSSNDSCTFIWENDVYRVEYHADYPFLELFKVLE